MTKTDKEKFGSTDRKLGELESKLEFYLGHLGSLENQLRVTKSKLRSTEDNLEIATAKLESSEHQVKILEQKNYELEEKLSQTEIDSKSTKVNDERKFLNFHHQVLESKEILLNKRSKNIVFIRTTEKMDQSKAKKQLISAIGKSLGENNASLAKQSIQRISPK